MKGPDFEIVKLPIPQEARSGANPKYPFAKMEVGDAFEIPASVFHACRGAAYAYGSRNDRKFSILKHPDGRIFCHRVK